MNLQQLLSIPDLDFAIFEEVLEEQYGCEYASQYKEVLQEMFMLELSPDADTSLCYWFSSDYPDEPEDYPVYEVSLFREGSEQSYDCDMIPWNELLAYNVDALIEEWVNTHQMLVEEVLAHIIYEITFYGMTEEAVQEKVNRLLEVIENPDLHAFEIPTNGEVLEEHEKYIPRAKRLKPADEDGDELNENS